MGAEPIWRCKKGGRLELLSERLFLDVAAMGNVRTII